MLYQFTWYLKFSIGLQCVPATLSVVSAMEEAELWMQIGSTQDLDSTASVGQQKVGSIIPRKYINCIKFSEELF